MAFCEKVEFTRNLKSHGKPFLCNNMTGYID